MTPIGSFVTNQEEFVERVLRQAYPQVSNVEAVAVVANGVMGWSDAELDCKLNVPQSSQIGQKTIIENLRTTIGSCHYDERSERRFLHDPDAFSLRSNKSNVQLAYVT